MRKNEKENMRLQLATESSLHLSDICHLPNVVPRSHQSHALPMLFPADGWPQGEGHTWATSSHKGPPYWATFAQGLPVGLSLETLPELYPSLRFSLRSSLSSSSFRRVKPSWSNGFSYSLSLLFFTDIPHNKFHALLTLPWHLLSRDPELECLELGMVQQSKGLRKAVAHTGQSW